MSIKACVIILKIKRPVLKVKKLQSGDYMRRILIVVDMQKDFIDGSLGTREAEAIVKGVTDKIKEYKKEDVFATMDTHKDSYLESQEGKNLPVVHCIENTKGWELHPDIAKLIKVENIFKKPSFGSLDLANKMLEISKKGDIEIELVGLCTDICVVSNALLIKAFLPEVKICVDPNCCAGVTVEKHNAAIETLRSCQVEIK